MIKTLKSILEELVVSELSINEVNRIIKKLVKFEINEIYSELLNFDFIELFRIREHIKHSISSNIMIENTAMSVITILFSFFAGILTATIQIYWKSPTSIVLIFATLILLFFIGYSCWKHRTKENVDLKVLNSLVNIVIEIKTDFLKKSV